MAAKPAGLEPRISDLVVESRIEAAWDPEAEQTTQIRTAVGVSARRRRVKSEETWKRKRILGQGAYGTVWLEECIASSGPRHGEPDLRAIKEIHKRPNVSTSKFHRELEAIAKFSHDRFAHCFVRSLGWFQNDQSLFITMEYLKHGDLQQYLTRPFPEPEARQISLQVVEALQLMHESGFAHRDLKPGNVLVFQKGPAWWVKIADFGISKRGVEASTVLRTMEIGTRGFMAPEILGLYCPDDFDEEAFEADEAAHDALAYTPVVDLWALGEITHRLLTQKPAFETRGRLWSYVTKGTPFPATELQAVGVSAQGISFIQEVMAASPNKRLTAATAISHDWLENHEFLDETRSRSSTESARETSPSGMTAIGYEPSAQWTEISQETQPTMKAAGGEILTPTTQPPRAEKVESIEGQSEQPHVETAILVEDGLEAKAGPATPPKDISSAFLNTSPTNTRADEANASPSSFHPPTSTNLETAWSRLGVESAVASLIDSSMLEQSVLTNSFGYDYGSPRDLTISYDDQSRTYSSRGMSPEKQCMDNSRGVETEMHATPRSRSQKPLSEFTEYDIDEYGRKVPRIKSPTASEVAITAGAVGAAAAITGDLSQLAFTPKEYPPLPKRLPPLPKDIVPEDAQEFRNIFAPAFDRPPGIPNISRPAPVQKVSGITSSDHLAEFPETKQADAICILRNPGSQDMAGVDIVSGMRYANSSAPGNIGYSYLFVDYNQHEFNHDSPEEMRLLHHIAEKTARSLGLLAYWGVLKRPRCPWTIRAGFRAVNDIVEFSSHFLFICRKQLGHSINEGLTRTRHLRRRFRKWALDANNIPVLVPALSKREFHIYTVHKDAPEVVLQPALSRAGFFTMMWGDKLAGAPSAFRILFEDTERDWPVLGKLERTLCFMELLAEAQAPPLWFPSDYLRTLNDYCEHRGELRGSTNFKYFVDISLSNPDLNLLGRWLCIPQFKGLYSSRGIKDLLGGSGQWEITTKIDACCRGIGLSGDGIIQYEGGWGHDIDFFDPNKSRSIKKRSPLLSKRFLVAPGTIDVSGVKRFPGLWEREFSINRLLQNHDASLTMAQWTLVDVYLGIVTYFLAHNRPTKLIICGKEDGGSVVRGMLCSDGAPPGLQGAKNSHIGSNGATQVINTSNTMAPMLSSNVFYHKENTVRIDGTGMDSMLDHMGGFRVSLSPKGSKEFAGTTLNA